MTRPSLTPVTEPTPAGPDAALDALARAIWAHGRDRGIRAMEALAATAINRRYRSPGRTLADLVRDPALFAAWDPNDPRHAEMQAVDSTDPAFAAALRVARRAMAGADGLVGGADHFVDDAQPLPDWASSLTPTASLAGFSFYRA
ncbi:MAG: cell wall hydrolase [Niveispirillum sp.]